MSRNEKKSVNRRDALKTIGVAGGAAVALGALGKATRQGPAAQVAQKSAARVNTPRTQTAAALDPVTRELFAPIVANGRVAGCSIVEVHPMKMGAIPVVLADAQGVRFQVDVLRHDTRANGINGVRGAGSFTTALHNQGAGDNRTQEAHGLAAMALLDLLAAREAEGAAVPSLLTLGERRARFPRAILSVIA